MFQEQKKELNRAGAGENTSRNKENSGAAIKQLRLRNIDPYNIVQFLKNLLFNYIYLLILLFLRWIYFQKATYPSCERPMTESSSLITNRFLNRLNIIKSKITY